MKNMLLILQVLKNKKNFFSPYRCRFLDGDDYIFLQIRNKHSTHTHTHTAASYINERNKISLPRVWQGKYYQYGNILQQAQRRVCLMFKTERVESQCHLQKWNAKNFHQAKSITASVTRRQKENVEKKKRVLTPGNIYSAEVKATTRERNEKEKIKLCFASLVCVCLLQVTAHGASTQKNTFALHVVVLNFIFPYAWVVRRWLSKKTIKKKDWRNTSLIFICDQGLWRTGAGTQLSCDCVSLSRWVCVYAMPMNSLFGCQLLWWRWLQRSLLPAAVEPWHGERARDSAACVRRRVYEVKNGPSSSSSQYSPPLSTLQHLVLPCLGFIGELEC